MSVLNKQGRCLQTDPMLIKLDIKFSTDTVQLQRPPQQVTRICDNIFGFDDQFGLIAVNTHFTIEPSDRNTVLGKRNRHIIEFGVQLQVGFFRGRQHRREVSEFTSRQIAPVGGQNG